MLFNSYVFIFAFLPIVLCVFSLVSKTKTPQYSIIWLIASSLFFYAWWNPPYICLILLSILFNFKVGHFLGKKKSKYILFIGVAINILLIAYYKYANFFVTNLNEITNSDYHLIKIILPLAISFFTFQQIAYLIDSYKGQTKDTSFINYCLFVTFFPQLIAGPIVSHQEILPQFKEQDKFKLKSSNISIGLTIFILGLFKKVVFADNIAIYSTPIFEAAESGVELSIFEAWGGALAYTFQIYFDFSGYSDMAIGLARMFGIILPINFYSPYKATSIIEFWRRWHITLSRFLRDHLYIPLGGNRKGRIRRYVNLFITMLIGGLWHGAGWTFILWGGFHGLLLAMNHAWRAVFKNWSSQNIYFNFILRSLGRLSTFIVVVIAWVIFRAKSWDGAKKIYAGMFGFNGISLPISAEEKIMGFQESLQYFGITFNGMFYNHVFGHNINGILLIIFMLIVVWFSPNVLELIKGSNPALGLEKYLVEKKEWIVWKFNMFFAIVLALLSVICILAIASPSEFLYFQF
ncbi:MAG: membrane-bound O-acyltransferase family protein [Planctomycetota bacterium]|nr:MAG: membrane-bound O-acyltransferase family protein [Planctomycetota bacterium]